MRKSILLITLFISHLTFAQDDLKLVNQTFSLAEAKAHIDFLASDELKGRKLESSEIDVAAKYLATELSRYGAKPVSGSYYQKVNMKTYDQPELINLNWKNEAKNDLIFLVGTDLSYEGDAIYLEFGSENDYQNVNVEGKLVICKGGNGANDNLGQMFSARFEKRKRAFEHGAIGLVELPPVQTEMWEKLKDYFERHPKVFLADEKLDKPHCWMLDRDSLISKKLKKGKKFKVSFEIKGSAVRNFSSKNVVAIIEGNDTLIKDEFIAYTAHYDHLGVGTPDAKGDSIYNGARDNTVGVATMLSTVKNFAINPTKRSALFVFFTAEEMGLLGSKSFVTKSPIPLDQIVFNLNSDNGGYNDVSAATIIGFDKTTYSNLISSAIEEAGLKLIADPSPEANLYERSDHLHFAKLGIPAVMVSMGVTSLDDEIYKYYHKTADNPETMDFEYLNIFFKTYMHLARKIANNIDKPFWVEGDKYYDKGVELYGAENE